MPGVYKSAMVRMSARTDEIANNARTDEGSVMELEEWSQVFDNFISITQSNKDSSKTKRVAPKWVMPYAKGKYLQRPVRTGKIFVNLISLVLSEENILLAYRNIKNNTGSNTAGTDKLTIADIGKLTPEEVTSKVNFIISGTKRGYRPKPVRRKDIPKPNGSTRPLGIPCIWDRLI